MSTPAQGPTRRSLLRQGRNVIGLTLFAICLGVTAGIIGYRSLQPESIEVPSMQRVFEQGSEEHTGRVPIDGKHAQLSKDPKEVILTDFNTSLA
jgi:hypothetical protein